ncbi:YczE/YyaS/YitT family protein [Secundilactobacillus similis]|uniref:Integral membrane protein n=1 Tax=Secundilactobacillus similis DSM 23365 = JCM 2765 TaxID=1423804 RepID=A0A0R2FAV8_9LACO|nr:DUF6198 family protein [Secundilactobacillus similis]KRN25522.1 integral membrane protein [Secundilactobacillus similis DSM 23365 = JCM 2765]
MLKRFCLLLLGIILMAAGVALSRVAALGTSPISSIPNVTSLVSHLTLGQTTIIFMIVLILLEKLILRHRFTWRNIVQLIPSLFFGVFIDGFVRLYQGLPLTTYWAQLIATLISIVILALGVYFEVNSQAIMMPGEGLTTAISLVTERPFPQVKIRQDLTMMVIAAVIALVFRHSLSGIREGTLLSAALTGRIVEVYTIHFQRLTAWMKA